MGDVPYLWKPENLRRTGDDRENSLFGAGTRREGADAEWPLLHDELGQRIHKKLP